ncbi:hypothetical protein ALC57_00314, partial [Trachymyrmex cornetzi]
RTKTRVWKWKEEVIEEVKEIKYLGYTLQKNGGTEKYIKERIKKATVAMKRTWSIGERIFRDNFERRTKMFNTLVDSIALYGAEVWCWQNDNRLDGIKRKYMKWILKLDWRTPNYILTEETKMEEIKVKAIRRAVKGEEESKWEKKRREVLERTEMSKEQVRREREIRNQRVAEEFMKRIERRETEGRQVKINESRYNDNYKNIRTEGLPKYLKGKKKMKDRSLIARFRCGNETKGDQYWREDEERRCRICHGAEENMTHILKECEKTKSEMRAEEFIGEEGLKIMKRIEKARREAEERERGNKNENPSLLVASHTN